MYIWHYKQKKTKQINNGSIDNQERTEERISDRTSTQDREGSEGENIEILCSILSHL